MVHGALGKMGQTVIETVLKEPGFELAGCVDRQKGTIDLPGGHGETPLFDRVSQAVDECRPDAVVDFSLAPALLPLARYILPLGINLVSGTTGLKPEELEEISNLASSHQTGVVIASNFAIGSILMQHLARIAAAHFESAEIIELHHDKKADAPSGTALTTAAGMYRSRGKAFTRPGTSDGVASRGQDIHGITVHSVRLPGILARQEVIFGAPGQTLSISHDAISRDCYMPGVIMALHRARSLKEMVFGLDKLLGL